MERIIHADADSNSIKAVFFFFLGWGALHLDFFFFFHHSSLLITQSRTQGGEKPKQKSRNYYFDTDFRQ